MNRYGEKVRAEWRKTGRRGRVEKRDGVRGARKCGTEV